MYAKKNVARSWNLKNFFFYIFTNNASTRVNAFKNTLYSISNSSVKPLLKSGQETKIAGIFNPKEFAVNEHSRAIIGRVAFHARSYGKKLRCLRDYAMFLRLSASIKS